MGLNKTHISFDIAQLFPFCCTLEYFYEEQYTLSHHTPLKLSTETFRTCYLKLSIFTLCFYITLKKYSKRVDAFKS